MRGGTSQEDRPEEEDRTFLQPRSRSTSRSGSTDLKTEDLKEELEAQIIILKNEIERLKE